MSVELTPPLPAPAPRIEYRGFQDVAGCREYMLVIYRPGGLEELRFSLAMAAFGPGGIRRQDAPDLCYQKVLQVLASGGPTSGDVINISDADLLSYRVAHMPVPPKRRASPVRPTTDEEPAAPRPPTFVPRRMVMRYIPAAAPAAPAFDVGQRVHHAVFGHGVTSLSSVSHTVVRFDDHGPKTFRTSLVVLDVLSEPHTWETGPRGRNRLRTVA